MIGWFPYGFNLFEGGMGCSILQAGVPADRGAWLCEVWYRILLIGCLRLSLGCDTWFTI